MNFIKKAPFVLNEGEEYFRLLANNIPEIIWTALPDGYEDFHNIRFTDYTGLREEDAKGLGWQQAIHPDDLKIVNKVWAQALERGENYEVEYRIKNRKGEYKWFLARAVPRKDKEGNIIKWFGITADIDYGKSLSLNLQKTTEDHKKANRELIRINDILNHFVYIAAHDLRSPVNNIKMLFELVKNESDVEKREELFLFMEKSILRLDRTVNGLVEVIQSASEDSGAQDLKFEEALHIVIADLSISYPDISQYISADFKNCPSIKYVKPFLVSIMKNLVSNSYKYKSSKRKLLINILSQRTNGLVKLEVRDNGIGFDENTSKNIFSPFKRFTGQGEGTGVGLYVLKNIVEKNGGKVEAWGEEDVGAIFTIFLKEYNSSKEREHSE